MSHSQVIIKVLNDTRADNNELVDEKQSQKLLVQTRIRTIDSDQYQKKEEEEKVEDEAGLQGNTLIFVVGSFS